MKKKLYLLLTLTISIFFANSFVYAVGGAFPAGNSGSSNNNNNNNSPVNLDGNGTNTKSQAPGQVGTKEYECYYSQSFDYGNQFSIDAYDLSGNSIVPYSPIPNKIVKAGTWVGIYAIETSWASWNVSNFHVYEIKKNYKCSYHKDGTKQTDTKYVGKNENCSRGYTDNGICKQCCTKTVQTMNPDGEFETQIRKYDCRQCQKTYTTGGADGEKEFNNRDYHEEFTCPTWNTIDSTKPSIAGTKTELAVTKEEVSGDPINCKGNAIGAAHAAALSKVGTTTTSVEYLQETMDNNTKKPILVPKQLGGIEISSTDSGFVESGSITKVYSFEPSKVCINLKTAQIIYGEDCRPNDYIIKLEKGTVYDEYLDENVSYWYYFIPLTAKSTTNNIGGNDAYVKMYRVEKLDFDQCENGMKDSGYELLISPSVGKYVGDYNLGKRNSTDYKQLQDDNKCYFSTVINFKVNQEFYNEKTENNTKKILGYGSYFRQIDINNPFPNGLSANSFWNGYYNRANNIYGLKNAAGNNLDASRPFARKTYVADLKKSEIDAIKAFNNNEGNSDKVYTSWKTMKSDGTSSFIKREYGVTRIVDKNSFYRLGCGPANKNWGVCDG